MNTARLRRQIAERLRSLSEERLRAAYHFVEYLHEHEDDPATTELLKVEGFGAALRRAERQAAAGRIKPLAKVRRHV